MRGAQNRARWHTWSRAELGCNAEYGADVYRYGNVIDIVRVYKLVTSMFFAQKQRNRKCEQSFYIFLHYGFWVMGVHLHPAQLYLYLRYYL